MKALRRKAMRKSAKAIVIAIGALTLGAAGASAEIVCNDDGDCWHVKTRHEYRPEFKLKVHPDDWKWSEGEHSKYRWREHEGRGYWRNGLWIEF
jgi:hypothetical protein